VTKCNKPLWTTLIALVKKTNTTIYFDTTIDTNFYLIYIKVES